MFGPHLIIDGSKCDIAKLADRIVVERILTDYPRAIGMTRIGGPYMFEYIAPDPAYSGVSGLVVIAESHIAIHTFPALDFFTMDIFSCKNFDHEVAIAYIREAFGVQEMDRMLVQRGLSFRGPHHGPIGATDDLIAAHAERYAGLEGVTIGSIPADDPLYPHESSGKMVWPSYGAVPDTGSYGADACAIGLRGSVYTPANAEALGAANAPAGFTPLIPMQLNPTASTGGVLDSVSAIRGPGRALGQILNRWEQAARSESTPIILALGPSLIADGLREITTELMHRGLVSAVVLEGDNTLADVIESAGGRHYVAEAQPTQSIHLAADEDAAAKKIQTALNQCRSGSGSSELLNTLGQAINRTSPRPGVIITAAEKSIPVFAVNAPELGPVSKERDMAVLQAMIQDETAVVLLFNTTAIMNNFFGSLPAKTDIYSLNAAAVQPVLDARVDAALALPLLATGLTQRIPKRQRAMKGIKKALQPV